MKPAIAVIALALLVASCGGGPRGRDYAAPPPPPPSEPQDIIGLTEPTPPPARAQRPAGQNENRSVGGAQAAAVPPARAVARWTSYKQFSFDREKAELPPVEASKVSEIAAYMARNPTLRLGIDGSDTRDAALGGRRVAAVRDALVKAGVPGARIETGAFSNARIKRDRGVEVLLINR